MTSTFSIFRRNQRLVMAALVVVAIISFVVAPLLTQVMSMGGKNQNTRVGRQGVLVKWKGGSIDGPHLQKLIEVSYKCDSFLKRLLREVKKNKGFPKLPGLGPNLDLGLTPTQPIPLMKKRFFAEKAKEMGIVFDDAAVGSYLRLLTDGKVTQQRFNELMREQNDLSQHDLYEFLKDEFAIRVLSQIGQTGFSDGELPVVTPNKNWQYFVRFNELAKIEAFPILVDDFKPETKPTEKELLAIFEKGKDLYPERLLPDPGFKRRYQGDFEFVSGNFEKYINAEKAKLTEDEILKAYEQRKASGRFQVPDVDTPPANPSVTTPDEGTPPSPGSEGTPAPSTAPVPAPAPAPSAENAPAVPASDKPAEGTVPPPEPAPAAVPSGTVPDATAPGTPAPVTPAPEVPKVEPPANPDGGTTKDQANVQADRAIRLVGYTQEAAPAAPAQERPPVVESPGTPASSDPVPADTATTPVPSTPAPSVPAPAGQEPPVPGPVDPIPPTIAAPGAPAAQAPKPMRTQTLEEVRDQLTREMVSEAAAKKLQAAMEIVKEKMELYTVDLRVWEARDPTDKTITKPETLDLQKLADENGLEYGETGFVDSVTVNALPIGSSRIQGQPFAMVLNANFSKFTPLSSTSFGQFGIEGLTEFVFWKVDEKKEEVPTFTEARKEVEEAWNRQEMRNLAAIRAGELASKVNSADDIGWSILKDTELPLVLKPGAFSWMRPGFNEFDEPRLSRVDALDTPGLEFMKQVFSTPPGKAVVAPNQQKSIFYVVRVIEKLPGRDALRTQFERSPLSRDSTTLGGREAGNIIQDWYASLEKEMQVEWIVPQEEMMNWDSN